MSGEHESGSPGGERSEAPAGAEHLNIKVTDNNNEVFFKIKRSTKLEKLMNAFCERQGKTLNSVRFLFEGQRVQPTDTPDSVSHHGSLLHLLQQPRSRGDGWHGPISPLLAHFWKRVLFSSHTGIYPCL